MYTYMLISDTRWDLPAKYTFSNLFLKMYQSRGLISSHTHQMIKPKITENTKSGKDIEQQQLSFTTDGYAKWNSHFERQFGCFLQD